MTSQVEVSVVIAARDAATTIGEQLHALSSQQTGRRWELIVVDNGSADATIDIVEQFRDSFLSLKVVSAVDKLGAAHARNVGAAHASGDLLLFCDADDVVADGWIDAMADGLAVSDAVGGLIEVEQLNSALIRRMRSNHPEDQLPVILGRWRRAVAANMGVRAGVFRAVGGFDETWQNSHDSELSIRLQVAGYTLAFVPDALVHYRYRSTAKATLRQVYTWASNQPRMYKAYQIHGARRSIGLVRGAKLIGGMWYLAAGKARRLQWLAAAARVIGHIVGSVRHRTLYL